MKAFMTSDVVLLVKILGGFFVFAVAWAVICKSKGGGPWKK